MVKKRVRSLDLTQGRFKSLLVEADEYLMPLSRYIHLNPVRLRRFKNAAVRIQAGHLKKYRWSSFGGYCYLRKRQPGIDYSRLLDSYFGGADSRGRGQYRQYVLNALGAEIENPFEDVMHQSILGTQEFIKWVKEKLPRKELREVPASRSLQRSRSADQVVDAVCRLYGVAAADILDRRARAKEVRQMAMELCYRYCNLGQKQVGQIFKVDYSTVSANRSRLNSRLNSDRRLKKQFDQIRQEIINLPD